MNFLTVSFFLLVSILVAPSSIHHHFIRFFPYISSPSKDNSSVTATKYSNLEIIPVIDGAVGPESFAFDRNGDGPYTGVSGGRIIKWVANESRWIDFAFTFPESAACGELHSSDSSISREDVCGRPLGLGFHEDTGELYIADAYMGLLAVGPNGGLATQVATQAQGIPFALTNSLDIDKQNGMVYFTDTSTRYQRRNYLSIIVSGDNSGRLMKFDPQSKQVTVLLDNLKFPNGVALNENGEFLLLAETTTCRILKVWLQTLKVEVIAELPGFPDNIKRNQRGEYWVGINSKRRKPLKWAISKYLLQKFVAKLPFDITSVHSYSADYIENGMGVRLDKDGKILEIVDDKRWKHVSEVEEKDGSLWVGSVKMSYAIKVNISKH